MDGREVALKSWEASLRDNADEASKLNDLICKTIKYDDGGMMCQNNYSYNEILHGHYPQKGEAPRKKLAQSVHIWQSCIKVGLRSSMWRTDFIMLC